MYNPSPRIMANLFLNKYRIESARATWHDYTDGIYFVTICTEQKIHYLGEIDTNTANTAAQMNLSAIGKFTADNLQNISRHYPYAEIPLFSIMPNHIHAVIVVNNDIITHENQQPAMKRRPVTGNGYQHGRLSVVIGGIKSAVSRWARNQQLPFAWQTRYHDHIVRNQEELNRIADYIENNVANWNKDELYS